jgi:hypothetical protein
MSIQYTRFIEVATGDYPITLDQIRNRLKATVSFTTEPQVEEMVALGYQPVYDTPIPVNDVVVAGPPQLIGGKWHQSWIERTYTQSELTDQLTTRKAELQRAAEDLRISQFERGFAYDFNEGTYHVQIRNDDRSNLTSLRIIAKEVVAAGGTMNFPFRVYENVGVVLSAEELVAMADAAFRAVTIGYQKIWGFKDGVTAATTLAELPTIPDANTLFTLPE